MDETTTESSENAFVQRLVKVPTGKKLPLLDEKILDHFWNDNQNKPFFNLQESATEEQQEDFM